MIIRYTVSGIIGIYGVGIFFTRRPRDGLRCFLTTEFWTPLYHSMVSASAALFFFMAVVINCLETVGPGNLDILDIRQENAVDLSCKQCGFLPSRRSKEPFVSRPI